MLSSYDPHKSGAQYLEDLATGYWFSEVLFTAVEMDIFTLLNSNSKTIEEISNELNCNVEAMERFLHALKVLGLVGKYENKYYNTEISSEYLVKGNTNFQGNSILWRKKLYENWKDLKKCLEFGGRVNYPTSEEDATTRIKKYIDAMDNIARHKAKNIIKIFNSVELEGELLDIGTGSGAFSAAFLEVFPNAKSTLVDIKDVLNYTKEIMKERKLDSRVSYCDTNILESWSLDKEKYDLIILSNIVHAYSEKEVIHILKNSIECLSPDGYIIVHDFFLDHFKEKAALLDINMFVNTYNGKVFNSHWIQEQLEKYKLNTTGLISLEDTGLIVATKKKDQLEELLLDKKSSLRARLKSIGFKDVHSIRVDSIHIPEWTALRCQFGCEYYGKPHCPPNSLTPDKTRNILKDFKYAFLLEGEPPTTDFQRLIIKAEKEAFKDGFYKAFAFWAGPCNLCNNCNENGTCKNSIECRPSMEGAGIDVFETVKRAGIELQTLNNKTDFVKYFGLLILE